MTEHTKLPWTSAMAISGAGHVIKGDGKALAVKIKPEDAAYIVKACNAYPELTAEITRLQGVADDLAADARHFSQFISEKKLFREYHEWLRIELSRQPPAPTCDDFVGGSTNSEPA